MKQAVIALGANLGRRETTIEAAISQIAERIGPVIKRSKIIETAPLVLAGTNPEDVPAYLNGAILVQSELSAEKILTELLDIERALGRDRSVESARWMSRVIDLDLICVEDEQIDTDFLRLPHPEMHKRDFVLAPMADVWPDWNHPVLNRSVTDLLATLD